MQDMKTLSQLCIQAIVKRNTAEFRNRITLLPEEVQVDIWLHLCHHRLVSDDWISLLLPIIANQSEINLSRSEPGAVTGDGLRLLSVCSQLTSLDLSGCTTLKSIDFAMLQGLTGLTRLDVGDTSISDVEFEQLSVLQSLKELNIRGCDQLGYSAVTAILRSLDDLSSFNYDERHMKSDAYPTRTTHYLEDSDDSDIEQQNYEKQLQFWQNYANR